MSRGLVQEETGMWLRNEVGIRAGQAASSSPLQGWGPWQSGGRPRPRLLQKPRPGKGHPRQEVRPVLQGASRLHSGAE